MATGIDPMKERKKRAEEIQARITLDDIVAVLPKKKKRTRRGLRYPSMQIGTIMHRLEDKFEGLFVRSVRHGFEYGEPQSFRRAIRNMRTEKPNPHLVELGYHDRGDFKFRDQEEIDATKEKEDLEKRTAENARTVLLQVIEELELQREVDEDSGYTEEDLGEDLTEGRYVYGFTRVSFHTPYSEPYITVSFQLPGMYRSASVRVRAEVRAVKRVIDMVDSFRADLETIVYEADE